MGLKDVLMLFLDVPEFVVAAVVYALLHIQIFGVVWNLGGERLLL
jgi:hypothetical protein